MSKSVPSARAQATQLLGNVLRHRRSIDEALLQHPLQGTSEDQAFARSLLLTVLRHVGQIDALIATVIDKPLPAKRVHVTNALRLGIAQLLLLKTPPHAAVNETVELVKSGPDRALAGLVNAVLQRVSREQPTLPAAIHNLPEWLRARWENFYGVAAVSAMAETAAQRPSLDMHLLAPATMPDGARLDTTTWRLDAQHDAVTSLPGYDDGAFWVQDVAASYPVRLLGDIRGLRILDIGAAPGGKTAQLTSAGAQVTALDRSKSRMRILHENMDRLKLSVTPVVADMLEWQPPSAFDVVVLDAPCSATGTWRRHPEVVHIVSAEDIAELALHQQAMLTRAWAWVRPGGRLVYCVCSLEREEGEAQAAWFLSAQADARLVVPDTAALEIPPMCITPEGYVRTLPHHMPGGMDGFFAAVLVKE